MHVVTNQWTTEWPCIVNKETIRTWWRTSSNLVVNEPIRILHLRNFYVILSWFWYVKTIQNRHPTPSSEVTLKTCVYGNNSKMANAVLGAQADFSTIQQIFSSSSDPKKQTCGISKYICIYFWKTNIFSLGGKQGDSCQNSLVQQRLTMSHPGWLSFSLSYCQIHFGDTVRRLLVHQKMALETSCCT